MWDKTRILMNRTDVWLTKSSLHSLKFTSTGFITDSIILNSVYWRYLFEREFIWFSLFVFPFLRCTWHARSFIISLDWSQRDCNAICVLKHSFLIREWKIIAQKWVEHQNHLFFTSEMSLRLVEHVSLVVFLSMVYIAMLIDLCGNSKLALILIRQMPTCVYCVCQIEHIFNKYLNRSQSIWQIRRVSIEQTFSAIAGNHCS